MTAKQRKGKTSQAALRRSTARLAAVQALYELDMSEATPDSVLLEFLRERWEEQGDELAKPDGELFTAIVRGVTARREDLDRMIDESLSGGWTVARLETVLRAILRAGTYELLARPDVPPRVVISEYVDVAHAFFSGGEASMTNGVLDRLARLLRAEEMEARSHGRSQKDG